MYFTAYIPQTFYAMLFSALSCYSTHQAQRGSFSLLGLNGPFFLWCSEHHLHKYGNPLQCSCLENPRDGGAWWAPVYGVAQSWTRLKRLSSSSIVSLSPFLFFVSKLVFFFCGEQIVGFIFNPMTVSFI